MAVPSHITREDLIELVQRQVDTVIGQTILREVVRPNALAAIAGSDQTFPMFRLLGM